MVQQRGGEAVELAVLRLGVEQLDDLLAQVLHLLAASHLLSELAVDLADLSLYLPQDALTSDLLLQAQARVLVELRNEPLKVERKVHDFPQRGLPLLPLLPALALFVERDQHCQRGVELLEVLAGDEVAVLLEVVGDGGLQDGLHLRQVVLGQRPDEREVVVDEGGGGQIRGQRRAALVDLGQHELQRLHLQLGLLLALQDVRVASAAEHASVRRTVVGYEHVGDLLGVPRAEEVQLARLRNQPLSNVLVHRNYYTSIK